MGNYDSISVYDVPQVVMGQALRDPLQFGHPSYWRKVLLDRDALTPQEREDLVDIIQKGTGLGADRVSRTILEAATNPFVWLGLLTSPVGGQALREGKSLFSVAKNKGWYQKHMGWFGPWLKTSLDNTSGSPIPAIAMQKAANYKRIQEEARSLTGPARKAMLDRLNEILETSGHRGDLKSLLKEQNVRLKGSNPVAWDLLERFHATQEVHVLKLDMGSVEQIKRSGGKRLRLEVRDSLDGEWRTIDMDDLDELRSHGIGPKRGYYDARIRDEKQRLDAAWEVYKREETGPKMSRAQFMKQNRLVRDLPEGPQTYSVDAKVNHEGPLIRDLDKYHAERAAYGQAFEDLLVAETRAKQYAYVKYLGDESLLTTDEGWLAGGVMKSWRPDRDKLAMLAQSVSRYEEGLQLADYERVALEGLDLLREAIGPDRAARILGRATPKGMKDLEAALDEFEFLVAPTEWGDTRWFSRNTSKLQKVGSVHLDVDGRPIMDINTLSVPEVSPPDQVAGGVMAFSGGVARPAYARTDKDLLINSDTLDTIFDIFGGSVEGTAYRANVIRRATTAYHQTGSPQVLHTLTADVQNGTDRYMRAVGGSAAEVTSAVTDDVIRADRDYWSHVSEGVMRPGIMADEAGNLAATPGAVQVPLAFGHGLEVNRPLDTLTAAQKKRTSLAMALDREYLKTTGSTPEAAANKRKYMMEFVRPAMGDRASEDFTAAYRSMQMQKQIAGWFVNSWAGKQIAKMGEPGSRMYAGLKAVAEYPDTLRVYNADKTLARYFYVTHLGVNASSIVLNLMQPLVVAATMGKTGDVLGAYKDALQDMWMYARKRGARGPGFPTVEQKLEDMKGSFGFMGRDSGGDNLLDIGPDFNQVLDSRLQGKTGFWARLQQVFMSGFEKSEWFNRDVTAHMVKRAYIREGLDWTTHPNFKGDARRGVAEFQFGQHDLNTPGIFLKGPLRSPLMRQFATFPLRSFTLMFGTAGTFGGGASETGLKAGTGQLNFWLRTMATSAFIHEVSRNLLSSNVDRGLALNTATEVFGGSRMMEHEEFPLTLTTPPVVDVIYGAMKGIATGDEVDVADAVARAIPGGVALSRAWGVGVQLPRPKALLGFPGVLQKTYAGWDQPLEGGMIPVYNNQGTLVDYKHWSALMARGLGIDMGAWGEQGQLDHYLTRQREEILKARHEYLRRLRANDVGGAMAISREFGRRFKDPNGKPLPLTVTKEQATRYLRNQITSRSERVLDALPPEVRGQYAKMVGSAGFGSNLPREAFGQHTARARDRWRPGADAINAQVEELLRRQGTVGPGAVPQGSL